MATARRFPLSLVAFVALGSAAATGLLHCGGNAEPTTTAATSEALASSSFASARTVTTGPGRDTTQLTGANHFQLDAGDLHVTYHLQAGVPVLLYQDATQRLSFHGSEVLTDATPAGNLISVVIHRTVDSGSITFSILIPRVQVGAGSSTPVLTQAITTFHEFSIVQRSDPGQLDQYNVTLLQGTGSQTDIDVPASETSITRPTQFMPNN